MIQVELSGVPGSGKTYLCTRIADELRQRRVQVATNPIELATEPFLFRAIKKAKSVILQILFHPVWTSHVLYIILSTHQSSFKSMLRSFITIVQVSWIVRKHEHCDVCLILDQGCVQASFSLMYDAKNMTNIKPERILPIPDILLEIDSPDSLLLSRLASRKRFQSRVEKDGESGIHRSRNIIDSIRHTQFYNRIPMKIKVPDERSESVVQELTNSIQQRISDEYHKAT